MSSYFLHVLYSLLLLISNADQILPETSLIHEQNEKSSTTKVVVEGKNNQKTTSLHVIASKHIESRSSENIDATNSIITPSVAPATPIEDLSTINNIESGYNKEHEQPQHETQAQQNDEKMYNVQISSAVAEEDLDKPEEHIKPDIKDEIKPVSVEESIKQTGHKSTKVDNSTDKDNSEAHTVYENPQGSSTNEEKPDDGSKDDLKMVVSEAHIEGPMMLDEDLSNSREDGVESGENMPSFNEWSQKFLAQEEEKNKVQQQQQNTEQNTSEKSIISKNKKIDRKQNNYASVDCGAKILEKNSEARNAESILIENKDFYMLNPCSVNIWFIVELCDHVHITSLQLANFEMFSSTTEKFQVSFSTRYPTREWSELQILEAKPEKAVQTFTLEPVFAKYMKVEQLSHHGSEHYCPWSLLRVYGNSMVEEYEEHESSQETTNNLDNNDEMTSTHNHLKFNQQSSGILHTATEAVLNFVKETAKKLVTTPSNNTNNVNDTSNATNQTENQKTIVQLMYCEDFEESCEEVYSCNTSTGNTQFSMEKFLEIVYNVCRCNLNKTCVTDKTCNARNQSINNDNQIGGYKTQVELNVDSINMNETKVDNATANMEHEDNENDSLLNTTESKIMSVETETSNSNVVSSKIIEEQSTTITQSGVTASTSAANIKNKQNENHTLNNINHSSSPTPLPQPPLAIDDQQQPVSVQHDSASIVQVATTTTTTMNERSSLVEDLTEAKRTEREVTTIEGGDDYQPSHNIHHPSDGQHLIKDDDQQVDILKFTVTNEKTKEGTAEPEETCATEQDTISKMTSHEEQHDVIKEEKIEDIRTSKIVELEKQSESGNMEKEIKKDEIIETEKMKKKNKCSEEGNCDEKDNLGNEVFRKDSSNKSGNNNNILTNPVVNTTTTTNTTGNNETDMNKMKSNHSKIHANYNENDPNIHMEKNEGNGKKESIFVVLSKKIKNLEQNVTMTNLFLEELSQRYRKSVEEIQKKMEKTSKTSKFLATVNAHQNSTILSLSSKLEKVEQKLEEVTSRLQTINQEVIERHLLGMSIQFLFLFILWLLFSRRSKVVLNQDVISSKMSGEMQNVDKDQLKSYIQKLDTPPKTPDGVHGETKRRRKRRQRNNDIGNTQDGNMVNKTAGLLFHSSTNHKNKTNIMIMNKKQTSTKRSCSLNDLEHEAEQTDHRTNKSKIASPKTRKTSTHQRNDGNKDGGKMKLFHFEEEPSLKKSKSLEETNKKICEKPLTTSCSLQSVNHHDQMTIDDKNRWIWGLG